MYKLTVSILVQRLRASENTELRVIFGHKRQGETARCKILCNTKLHNVYYLHNLACDKIMKYGIGRAYSTDMEEIQNGYTNLVDKCHEKGHLENQCIEGEIIL
jgi:hypothetical protein